MLYMLYKIFYIYVKDLRFNFKSLKNDLDHNIRPYPFLNFSRIFFNSNITKIILKFLKYPQSRGRNLDVQRHLANPNIKLGAGEMAQWKRMLVALS